MESHPPILDANLTPVGDGELEALLRRVYVDGGFTDPEVASSLFAAAAVRQRGRLPYIRDPADGSLIGMVIVVPPASPARRLASTNEVEMHLLAVSPERRRSGIGQALVDAAMAAARADGYARMVLWTQPTMHTAQRLYERSGFARCPERDWTRDGRAFWVYERDL